MDWREKPHAAGKHQRSGVKFINALDQMNRNVTAEYKFFRNIHGTISRLDMLDHKWKP